MQAVEKATAPFALKSLFPLPLYGFAVFSPRVPNYLSFFFSLGALWFCFKSYSTIDCIGCLENGALLAVCGLPAAKCCQWDSRAFRSIDRAIMALFSTLSPSWGCA